MNSGHNMNAGHNMNSGHNMNGEYKSREKKCLKKLMVA